LPLALVHRTLQLLVREGVPIRPLSGVLELMADHAPAAADAAALAEGVRQGLARTICRRLRDEQGRLSVVRLSEATVAGLVEAASTRGKPDAKALAAIRRAVSAGGERSSPRPVVVPGRVRRQVRDLLVKSIAGAVVLAEEELADDTTADVFATVGDELARAA
jgi:flagellar biosynthesis protein FlhA